ncbi:MAG: CocE/NonD family hydrolase, partial [Lacisediminihabitans sp.]
MSATHDRPWHRPGAAAYARKRIRTALRPPVTVYEAPADLVQERDVAVAMRDGVKLRLNLFRPAGNGPFPVLMSAHPYSKDALPKKKGRGWSFALQYRIMNQPAPVRFSELTSWEAPDPAWWVAQGYAVINADTRGAGHSEGTGDLLSDQEALDYYDLIEWAAARPWSSGNVGLLGVSYLALSQYKVAALNPPSLKAICPWEGFTDIYRDFCTPGGIAEDGFTRIWLYQSNRIARLHKNIGVERRDHPLQDAWWQSITPDLASIRVPILVCTSFSDNNVHSIGSMRVFDEAGS